MRLKTRLSLVFSSLLVNVKEFIKLLRTFFSLHNKYFTIVSYYKSRHSAESYEICFYFKSVFEKNEKETLIRLNVE